MKKDKITRNNKNRFNFFIYKNCYSLGYSLVEILIYLAIFSFVSTLVINSFIVMFSSFNTTRINHKILQSGMVSMERLSREIRQAQSINPETTANSLVLNSLDDSGNSVIYKFIKEGQELNLYKDDVLEGNMLGESQNIFLNNLVFRKITTTESEAIKIEMTLEYPNGENSRLENFYNTIVLRGGY